MLHRLELINVVELFSECYVQIEVPDLEPELFHFGPSHIPVVQSADVTDTEKFF